MDNPEILRLFQAACKNHRGGITAVAGVMGISPVILANKLNPNYEQNHLTLSEACEVLEIMGDRKPLCAMAYLIDEILMPAPVCDVAGKAVIGRFMTIWRACSHLGDEVLAATDDDSELGEKLSGRERREIVALLDALIAAAVCLRQSL